MSQMMPSFAWVGKTCIQLVGFLIAASFLLSLIMSLVRACKDYQAHGCTYGILSALTQSTFASVNIARDLVAVNAKVLAQVPSEYDATDPAPPSGKVV